MYAGVHLMTVKPNPEQKSLVEAAREKKGLKRLFTPTEIEGNVWWRSDLDRLKHVLEFLPGPFNCRLARLEPLKASSRFQERVI